MIRLSNGTAAQEAVIDNRTGVVRLIAGASVRLQASSAGLAFHGTAPIAKPALAAAATDAASTQTLVNDIRAKLIAYGLTT